MNPNTPARIAPVDGSALGRIPGVETAVSNALAPYADVQVQTRAQFDQSQVASVNQLLGLIYALLALAVLKPWRRTIVAKASA